LSPKGVNGFFQRLGQVPAVGCDTREIDEFDQDAAIRSGGEFGGVV
jgi:hypothetical protein